MRATGVVLLMIYQKTVAILSSFPGAMQAVLLSLVLSVVWLASLYYFRKSARDLIAHHRSGLESRNGSLTLKTHEPRRYGIE